MNPEKAREILLEGWDWFYRQNKEHVVDDDCRKELKMVFLSSNIVNLVAYDAQLYVMLGKEIHEVMKVIFENRNFEYIKDKENHIRYIRTINYFIDWVEWGTSIRGAWFEYGSIQVDGTREPIELSEDFMGWLLDWLGQ